MRVLKFIVTGQNIRKSPECDFSDIVAGSIGYLEASFEFSDEWDGCKKEASFRNDNVERTIVLDDSNICTIPSNVLTGDRFFVSVVGTKTGYEIGSDETKVLQDRNTAFDWKEDQVDGVEPGIVETIVKAYLDRNPVEGTAFTTDETLDLTDGVLSVNTADAVEADNSLPVTSAAVQTVVGNIEVLLKTI